MFEPRANRTQRRRASDYATVPIDVDDDSDDPVARVPVSAAHPFRGGRTLAAQLFWPRPRVSSRVVHLARETGVQPSPEELGEFDALVDALFQKRRKQLLSILAEELGERATAVSLLGAAGLDPRDRPERATVGQLLALSRSRGWTGRGRKNPGDR